MHQEISDQHQQKCVLPADPHRLRNHVGKRHRQHVPRAQRHKVMQETPRPRPPHHKQPTNQVPRSGHHPQPRRHPHSSCDVVIHFGVRQSCCRFRGVCIAKACSAGRSPRSPAAFLPPLFLTSFSYFFFLTKLAVIPNAGTKSHPLPAPRTLAPPTAPAPSPAPPQYFPPPANHSIALLPRE